MTQNDETGWSAWNSWADQRIQLALARERQFWTQVVAGAIAQRAAAERKILRRDFAKQLQQLKSEVVKAQRASCIRS